MAEWIEMFKVYHAPTAFLSPLAMAEWIEIIRVRKHVSTAGVSASDGGVD